MVDKAKLIREAQKFIAKGQLDRAIGIWEDIAKASPESNTLNFLGDLYLKKGDRKAAVAQFQKAARIYLDEGFTLKGLAIFKKILNINPHDAGALIALGDINEEKKIVTDAIKYYLAAADTLAKEKKNTELLAVYKKILNLAPTNIQLKSKISELLSREGFVQEAATQFAELGRLYDEKGESDKARTYFQKSMEIVPNNKVALLSLSVMAERAGDTAKAMEYTQAALQRAGQDPDLLLRHAHLLMEAGQAGEAARAVEQVVAADPNNLDACRQLAELTLRAGDTEKAWEQYAPVLDAFLATGRFEDAASIVEGFRGAMPVEASQRLVTVHRQAGATEAAFSELMTLAAVYRDRGMETERLASLKEALALQPDNEQVKRDIEQMEAASAGPAPAAPPEPAAAASTMPGLESASAAEEPAPPITPAATTEPAAEKSIEEALTEADIFIKYGLHGDALSLLESLKTKAPDNMDVHLKLKALYEDTKDTEQAVTECIVLANLSERAGDEEGRKTYLKQAHALNPGDPRLEGKLEGIVESAPAGNGPTGSPVPGTLAGDGDEGLESFEDLMPEMEPVEAQEHKEPEFDNEVMEIFDEFKKGLEAEIDSGDSETHYNLGIAYKEMGLVDDAIKEFQVISQDPNYYIQSATMLGICYLEKGLYDLAIDAFTGALMKMDPSDESAWGLKYDLAQAYERNGSAKEALQLYTEVYSWNATFRDVGERVDALRKEEEEKNRQKEKKSRVSYI